MYASSVKCTVLLVSYLCCFCPLLSRLDRDSLLRLAIENSLRELCCKGIWLPRANTFNNPKLYQKAYWVGGAYFLQKGHLWHSPPTSRVFCNMRRRWRVHVREVLVATLSQDTFAHRYSKANPKPCKRAIRLNPSPLHLKP